MRAFMARFFAESEWKRERSGPGTLSGRENKKLHRKQLFSALELRIRAPTSMKTNIPDLRYQMSDCLTNDRHFGSHTPKKLVPAKFFVFWSVCVFWTTTRRAGVVREGCGSLNR